jgi:hypothetical protein
MGKEWKTREIRELSFILTVVDLSWRQTLPPTGRDIRSTTKMGATGGQTKVAFRVEFSATQRPAGIDFVAYNITKRMVAL